MKKEVIFDNGANAMFHYEGITKFTGCQCFKDCDCRERFIPQKFSYYTVLRRNNRNKTTRHYTLESAIERWKFVNTLEKMGS